MLHRCGMREIKKGLPFLRYYPGLDMTYDEGLVTRVDHESSTCDIDFGDSLVRYLLSDVSYAYNDGTDQEHHMSIKQGVMLADFRSNPSLPCPDMRDDVLGQFEDILKRLD